MNIIYLRTSTEEQNPENQLKDCLKLFKKLKLENYELYEEKQSAFKDIKREKFENIKKLIMNRKVKIIICWDLDRLFRNRMKLVQFFELCKIHDCKIYSFRQQFLEDINKAPEPWNQIIFKLMLEIMGWIAEDESKKKSDRVRNAIRNKYCIKCKKYYIAKEIKCPKCKGDLKITKSKSYKGNKWGRRKLKKVDKQILELRKQGKTIRKISEEVFYWDKNNHKKFVSVGYIHKLLVNQPKEINSKTKLQEVTN